MSNPSQFYQIDLTAQRWPVKAGATYLFTPGGATEYLIADGKTYRAQTTFTYLGSGCTLVGYAVPFTSTVQQVYQGVNNAVLVYDYLTQMWAGQDDGTDLAIQEMVTMRIDGTDRLVVFTADGLASVYEDLDAGDQVRSNGTATGIVTTPIVMEILTRGYNFQNQGSNKVAQVEITGNSLGSMMSLTVESPGGVVATLMDQYTPDRTAYSQPAWAARWVDGNLNQDASKPYRLDYSLVVPTTGYTVPATGAPVNWLADWQRRFRPGPNLERAVRVRFTSWSGQGELISVVPGASPGDRRAGLLA